MNTKGSISLEENRIKNDSLETVLVFSQEGKLLTQASGSKDEVKLNGNDIDLLEGSVTSHNHPQGTSFSITDILTIFECRIREAHVVTSHNISYILEILDFKILEEEHEKLHKLYYNSIILGSPHKKHRSNYQKMLSKIMYDLFEDIEEINYYEIGEYKEWPQ